MKRQKINDITAATTVKHLSTKDILKIRTYFPSIEAQHRIGKVLSTIDQAIEKTEALIEKYQQIKAGLMHDLFTRGIGADGKLRPPREEAPELYQQTVIGWIPKDWSTVTIEKSIDSLVDGPFGSNLKSEHYVVGAGVRVVRLQNIQKMKYNDSEKAFVSIKHANSLFRNHVVSGDILIAGLGEDRHPVGRACIYPNDLPNAINKADCFRMRCNPEILHNDFMMYYLNTEIANKQVRTFEQGVTRSRINLGNMKKLLVPCPGIKEQRLISGSLSKLEEKIDNELYVYQKLVSQKLGLMQDLLTGKVPVKVPTTEQATA